MCTKSFSTLQCTQAPIGVRPAVPEGGIAGVGGQAGQGDHVLDRRKVGSNHRRRINTEENIVVTAASGPELIQFLATLAILRQDDLKKRINRITATWWNGCFEKLDDPSEHTKLRYHLTKMDVLQKTFLQIILAAKWSIRHSRMSTSTNQQRRLFFVFSSVFFLLIWS